MKQLLNQYNPAEGGLFICQELYQHQIAEINEDGGLLQILLKT